MAARRLADIAGTIRRFGRLAGTEGAADAAATAFENRVAALRTRYAGRPAVPVFYQIAQRPLLTINREHLIDDVLRLCGGVNVFAGLQALTPMVSPEAVLAADPEAIVAAGGEAGNETGFATWKRLPGMLAVRRNNFIMLHSDTISRQSARIVEGAGALCDQLERVRAKRGR